MKKKLSLLLALFLIFTVFAQSSIASKVELIHSKEVEESKDHEDNTYGVVDFDIDNGKVYILDNNKLEIETKYTTGDMKIVKLEDEDSLIPSMISLDSGVMYILYLSVPTVRQIIEGEEPQKDFKIEGLDTEAVSEFSVKNGKLYITVNEEEKEITKVFKKENEKFILEKTLSGRISGDYSYEFQRENENIYENFGGALKVHNLKTNYKNTITIKNDQPLFGLKVIGNTENGNLIIISNEQNKDKKNVQIIKLVDLKGKVVEEYLIDEPTSMIKSAVYQDGTLYYAVKSGEKIEFNKIEIISKKVDFNLYIRGKLSTDGEMFIEKGRIFAPIRYISETLGYEVNYVEKNKDIIIKDSETEIKMNVESNKYSVNGEENTMDTYPILKEDRTYVPIRFVSESMGEKVEWDERNFIAMIGEFTPLGDTEGKTKKSLSEVGLNIYLPKDFEKSISIEFDKENKNYSFYDKKNKDGGFGGYLGSIAIEKYPGTNIVSGIVLYYENGEYTTITFASDVNYDTKNKEYKNSYENSLRLLQRAVMTVEELD